MTNAAKIEFDAKIENIKINLSNIIDVVSDGLNIENPDWGHVGLASDIDDALQQITDKLFKQGEYAND